MGSSRQVVKLAVGSMLVVCLAPGVVAAKKATATRETSTVPYVYTVQSGDTLYLIAQRTGTTVDALRSTNSLANDMIYPGQSLSMPSSGSGTGISGTSGSRYTVQSGDTLYLIAQRTGTSVTALAQANGLSSAAWLYPGQTLVLTGSGGGSGSTGGSGAGSAGSYTVQSGDSLFFIAARYGTTVAALQQANGITAPENLRVGQTLVIPGSSTPSTPAPSPGGQAYAVRSGDTLFLIAQRYGTTVAALQQANGITDPTNLAPGTVLQLPASPTPSPDSSGRIVEPGIDLSTAVWGSKYVVSQQDYELLARLVSAEAQGEPYDGQVAVAATVLHRMTDSRFPATVNDIIYQGAGTAYPQYSPVYDGAINNPAVTSAYQAVRDALDGTDPSNGANGFYNPTGTENTWVKSQPVTTVIGNHVFFQS